MQLEIFRGKKAKYNKLILRALYDKGYLKAWDIAKEVVMNDPERKVERKKRYWYQDTLKVYSVFVRKGGRLEELLSKEFIETMDKRYRLTFNKGICSALTLYENIREPAIDELSLISRTFPEFKQMFEIISRLYPETGVERYKIMLRVTERLLEKGLSFDRITNRQFNEFFNSEMNETLLRGELMKEENKVKWKEDPELQECILKFMNRMKSFIREQMNELDKSVDSLEKSFGKGGESRKKKARLKLAGNKP